MKCPKCSYLGFETGDRCKNCGYDFSLMTRASEPDEVEIDVDRSLEPGRPFQASNLAALPEPAPRPDPVMPLFARSDDDDPDDQPLIKLSATPRAPLAVRKTPEIPRLRAVPRPVRRAEPALELLERIENEAEEVSYQEPEPAPARAPAAASHVQHAGPGSVGARAAAMGIDHLILAGVDAVVLYFTLKMAGLSAAEWRALPAAPLLTFVMLLKLAYFSAFTAVGGQTIGKMAMKIRVVTDDDGAVDGARSLQRTMAAAASSLLLGLGFVPALMGTDRRALHDRVAHTRVVALRSV
jgi:uncharacterized RDD family membrane protein YckC